MINWKVRIKNKLFWMTMIPYLFILIHKVLILFGIDFDFTTLQAQILDIVEIVFAILAGLGIVTDLTTEGIGDSSLAMTYEIPKTKDGVYKVGEENGKTDE